MRVVAAACLMVLIVLPASGPLPVGAQPRPAPAATPPCHNPPRPAGTLEALVTRVIDGDTIQTHQAFGGRERVRLIGIDSPEVHESDKLERDARSAGVTKQVIQALGQRAWDYTRTHLDGKDVELELDVERRDRYARLLAYVWMKDGTLFNMQILRDGFAQLLTIPPNVKYVEIFIACQREAREQRRGLWAP